MNLPSPPSLQMCQALEQISGDEAEELAADVRNVDRYIDCQKKTYKWVKWYLELNKTMNK